LNEESNLRRVVNLVTVVDAFLHGVEDIMNLSDTDIPDNDIITAKFLEAKALKADLFPERNLECANRMVLIDAFLKHIAETCFCVHQILV
jgi:hypothetical protein